MGFRMARSINMEQRMLKVMFNKAGGNSGKNSINTRISLPKIWVDEMGITPEERETKVSFQDNKIIIEKNKE